jgi:hypothetical protein
MFTANEAGMLLKRLGMQICVKKGRRADIDLAPGGRDRCFERGGDGNQTVMGASART